MNSSIPDLFQKHFNCEPTHRAFAPGRIEVLGNHTDYNGGLALGVATAEGITVGLSRSDNRLIRIISSADRQAEVPLDNLTPQKGTLSWINYPIGVTKVMQDAGMQLPTGYNMAVHSNLPEGGGMSSSAAFELATAHALAALYGFKTDTLGFARIGQTAENEYLGMPCGLLDQGISAFGKADQLIKFDASAQTWGHYPIPTDTRFWIFNSNQEHRLIDSPYADRHRECREALAQLQRDHPKAQNLSQISQPQLEASGDQLDPLLYRRAAHIIGENARVQSGEAALRRSDLRSFGQTLNESHKSSQINFENSIPELDTLVELLKKQPNVYGARLSGGGFGGAVMALTHSSFNQQQADSIATAYLDTYGFEPSIFQTRSSDGARLL